ncbi:MAG: biopolymer transporter ExbD [Candidatus Nealsonbacteria bacterium]|nr:biopolymer transporter ExbD [Candidatus Nealsonbacteria bacterium]
MRLKERRKGLAEAKPEMTPMIDMTFQLIAFFMVIVNFSEAESNEAIKLPSSQLAKPPEGEIESLVVLQLTKKKNPTVFFGGRELQIGQLKSQLWLKRRNIEAGGKAVRDATVVIRADRYAKTAVVQEVIKICQEVEFVKFALRAKQGQRDT